MDLASRWSSCEKRLMMHVALGTVVAAAFFFMAQAETSKTTRCFAPSVYEGEPATVTCDFGGPLNLSLTTLSVDYRGADGKQKSIVNCFPSERNTSKCIYYKDWLRLRNDTMVTSPLIVDIPHATRDQSGTYSCHLVPPSGTELPCLLEVKKRVGQSLPTQQRELPDARRQTDEVKRKTARGLQNTTKPATFSDLMPWAGDNDVVSTGAGTIAAAVVASLVPALVLVIGVVAYRRHKRFRKSVRSCCRRAVSKTSETGRDGRGVYVEWTHVPPKGARGELETCPLKADHYGTDRNGSAVDNGDVHPQTLTK